MDQTCSVTSVLANGIPDSPVNGGWDTYVITGSTQTSITQHDTVHGSNYLLGSYSHTTDAVSYYTNGDDRYCGSARRAQLTWNCGDRHMELIGHSEPITCEYHFEIEIQCCQGMIHNDRIQ